MIEKEDLKNARLQLHQAVQLLAAVGISFLEKKADDSHTNLQWHGLTKSLICNSFGADNEFRLSLNFRELKYQLFEDKNVQGEFVLNGKTEDNAVNWLKEVLQAKAIDISSFTMNKHYDIPPTDQAQDHPYNLFDVAAFTSLADHFDMANKTLSEIAGSHKKVSAIRCWPHHFDLGMLITLQENQNPQEMKSVGLGLSPGDGSYNQPYYYVSPWPYPDKNKLNNNDLVGDGFWHSDGFTSAILLADSYLKSGDMEKSIFNFLSAALQINTKMILD